MHITYLTLFPELFDSFRETTLISRSVKEGLVEFETINPRYFTDDRHRTVDDEIYGGGHGLLMKAQPIIDSVRHRIEKHQLNNSVIARHEAIHSKHNNHKKSSTTKTRKFKIIIPHPSLEIFAQKDAHDWSEHDFLLFICGRYEGIDERVWLWLQKEFPDSVVRISLGQFVTLGGELPAMTMSEAVVRLLPGVIHSPESWQEESYSIDQEMKNIEHPQYTRPEIVEEMSVPTILLSGHHKNIKKWKSEQSWTIQN